MRPADRWWAAVAVVALAASGGAVVGSRQEPPGGTRGGEGVVTAVDGDWDLGPFTADVATTVGSSGGVVEVDGGPLDGLTVEVPEAAVADGTAITIEHADIRGHTWGNAVDPVTPAIRIEVGDGANAQRALTVSVPVDLADGQYAMGLFVHDDGSLEGMALGGSDESTVTVVTQHFSDWFVSAFLPSRLPAEIFTGYQLARDNLQFVNHGSWTSPGGICAGMSAVSMWYFLEQYRANDAPGLFGLYDYPHGATTPGFDGDDAHAIRWASMVQRDGRWGSSLVGTTYTGEPTVWDWYRDARDAGKDDWQFEAFRYSMYLTGEPQLVLLSQSPQAGGHAVVAYGVTTGTAATSDGFVWIADPNTPFRLNSLDYDATARAFRPYEGWLQADGTPYEFRHVGYAAKSALFDWNLIGQRYQEMLAGTVGDGVFPTLAMYQKVVDPTTGVASWVATSSPAVDAAGTVELAFLAQPGQAGRGTWVTVMADGGTTSLGWAVSRAGGSGGGSVEQSVVLRPGAGGGSYKLVVRVERANASGAVSWEFVDAVPMTVLATVATTTTSSLPPMPPTTVAPTTLPPVTVPPVTYDCSACPPGVAGIDCRLHCEGI